VKDIRGVIRSAFAQRRKTLRNSLSGYAQTKYGVDIRSVDTPFLDKRAEELTLHDFDQLLREIQSATT
jgi:16S rRNA A1518/A1519 N6-dimethyltransferase RsmA/KsgA/DIM1 with predicted DNA glycosylase/AP lyase activity